MVVVWNPWGVLGLVVVVATTALAWLVYRAGPSRPINRSLALLVVAEGVLVTACDDGVGLFFRRAGDYYSVAQVHASAHIALPFLYLIFLGRALDTPLVAPLKHRAATLVLLLMLAAAEAYRFLEPARFVPGLAEPWYAPWGFVPGPAFVLVLQLSGIVSVFGLAATVDAWRRARTTGARARARAYAVAFGFHDLYWAVLLLVILPHTDPYVDVAAGAVFMLSMPLLTLAFVSLLGYGLLRTQMLDIDLRIKSGVRRSVVVGAFVVAFFLASEGIEALVSGRAGTLAGLAAAGLLLVALRPLERGAARVADRVMPGAEDTPEYRVGRGVELYRAALESAAEDGEVTDKERAMLATLRERLGIREGDAAAMERDALAGARGVA